MPQVDPLDALPVTAQTEAPVAHAVFPVLQVWLGMHVALATHVTHVPFEHTRSAPHVVPFAIADPMSTHVGVPPVQVSLPV